MDIQKQPEGLADKIGGEVEKGQDDQEMCCDGKQTAAEHRHNSEDGKCCIDK